MVQMHTCACWPRPYSAVEGRRQRRIHDWRQLPRQSATHGTGRWRLARAEDLAGVVRLRHVDGRRPSGRGRGAAHHSCSMLRLVVHGALAVALIELLAPELRLVPAQGLLGLGLALTLLLQQAQPLLLLRVALQLLPPHGVLHRAEALAGVRKLLVQAHLLRLGQVQAAAQLFDAVRRLGALVGGPREELRQHGQWLGLLHDGVQLVAGLLDAACHDRGPVLPVLVLEGQELVLLLLPRLRPGFRSPVPLQRKRKASFRRPGDPSRLHQVLDVGGLRPGLLHLVAVDETLFREGDLGGRKCGALGGLHARRGDVQLHHGRGGPFRLADVKEEGGLHQPPGL
mmetsp:Transcript_80662/g.251524  ORF Transcript_80662/g.251524 Transcript_80662/m.251524 type:complete len:341 (+) Transcript_80662:3-1025(+)